MKYGCIGEHLGHSFSREIHERLSDYEYELCELSREELDGFFAARDFLAINVTIPYKEPIIPYLYYIDEDARRIGAVNTVVNKGGALHGYNTDFFGMSALIKRLGISLDDKKVVILGTGGTSKTARAVALAMGARCVVRVSRTSREDAVSYEELYERHSDAEVIVNTTPVGMYPRIAECPVELSKFTSLVGAVDAVYNPLSTPFVLEARARGAAAEGGLYMLVAQAVRASEIFLDTVYPEGTIDEIYGELLLEKENIVLTGMPASGKSTVGGLLARTMNRELIDTDELVKRNTGMEIPDIFAKYGEDEFRRLESEAIASVAALTSRIIATGGGAILRDENVSALKKNGRLFFIDRPPERLIPTSDRPLSSDRDAILKRYNERYERYCNTADVRIDADCTPDEAAEKILKRRKSI